jgi:hypothetical protein
LLNGFIKFFSLSLDALIKSTGASKTSLSAQQITGFSAKGHLLKSGT